MRVPAMSPVVQHLNEIQGSTNSLLEKAAIIKIKAYIFDQRGWVQWLFGPSYWYPAIEAIRVHVYSCEGVNDETARKIQNRMQSGGFFDRMEYDHMERLSGNFLKAIAHSHSSNVPVESSFWQDHIQEIRAQCRKVLVELQAQEAREANRMVREAIYMLNSDRHSPI